MPIVIFGGAEITIGRTFEISFCLTQNELKSRQDELRKNRVQIEADIVVDGVEQMAFDMVKSYVQDLRTIIVEAVIAEEGTFLRSFIGKIEINGDRVTIHYHLSLPQGKKEIFIHYLCLINRRFALLPMQYCV